MSQLAYPATPVWQRAAAWGPLVVGAGLWTLPISRIPLEEVGDTGVLTLLPIWCWLGLALVLAGTAWAIWDTVLHEGRAAAHVVVLVALLYGGVVASSPYPRGTVPWRHVGIAAEIASSGQVDPGIDAYFNWPGYFALLASWSGMSGLDDASVLMRWAPVANNLLYLIPLLLLARVLVPDRRLGWAGIVLFYLANWVDQDYLAPQALGFLLYLCVVALLLTFFATPDRLAALLPGRARAAPAPPTEGRARLLVAIVLVITAVVTAHQLTPFALLLAVAVLSVLRSVSVRGLAVLTAALIVAWMAYPASAYVSGHLDRLLAQVGDFAGAAQGGIVERAQGSAGHLLVIRARIGFSALIWALGAAGAVVMLRRGQLKAAAAALLAAPMLLFPLQSYGGEMLLRIFLFSLPFTALLAAQLLPGAASGALRRRSGVIFLVAALLITPAFVLVRYGNQVIDQRRPGEVAAVRALYAAAPPGSLLVAGNTSTPWRNDEYAQHRHRTLEDLPEDGRLPTELDAAADLVYQAITASHPRGLVLLTAQQREYDRLLGSRMPWKLADLERVLLQRNDLQVVYRNDDAVILRPAVVVGPLAPGPGGPPPVVGPPTRAYPPGFVGPVPPPVPGSR